MTLNKLSLKVDLKNIYIYSTNTLPLVTECSGHVDRHTDTVFNDASSMQVFGCIIDSVVKSTAVSALINAQLTGFDLL